MKLFTTLRLTPKSLLPVITIACLCIGLIFCSTDIRESWAINQEFVMLAHCAIQPASCDHNAPELLEFVTSNSQDGRSALGNALWAYFVSSAGSSLDSLQQVDPNIGSSREVLLHFWRGRLAEAHGDMTMAYQEYEKVPQIVTWLTAEGRRAVDNNDLNAALPKLELAARLHHPTQGESLFYLGVVYAKMKRYDQAEKALQSALTASPWANQGQLASAYWWLGSTWQQLKKLNEARQAYEKAIEIQPGFEDVYYRLYMIYREQHDLVKAEDLFQQGVRDNPGNINFELMLGQFFKDNSNTSVAERYLQDVARRYPERPEPWEALGLLLFDQQDYSTAKRYFLKAVQLEDQIRPVSHHYLGALYATAGDNIHAVQEYELALSVDNNPWTYLGLAKVHLNMNQTEKAISELKQALLIDANFEPARQLLSEVQYVEP